MIIPIAMKRTLEIMVFMVSLKILSTPLYRGNLRYGASSSISISKAFWFDSWFFS